MRSILLTRLFLFLSILISLQTAFGGEINGTVTINLREPDPQSPISPYAHNRNGGIQNSLQTGVMQIVVYLSESPALKAGSPPVAHPVMDQRNLTIHPHILPIQVGTTVDFPNSDALYHNLFSLSPARKFDLGRYPKGDSKSVTFKTVGEVHLFCDIHPTMSAVILVLPNQYYTTTNLRGEFKISNVPPGEFTINVWHEQLKDVSQKVIVPESGNVSMELNLGN